jgi:hypothetical protein
MRGRVSHQEVAMTLRQQQSLFVRLVAKLILWAHENGMDLTFGEAWRSPEEAKRNAARGAGTANSLHTERLAIDLNLFVGGVYMPDSSAYARLGEYWESLNPACRWGGKFRKPDGNHFSFTPDGKRA